MFLLFSIYLQEYLTTTAVYSNGNGGDNLRSVV